MGLDSIWKCSKRVWFWRKPQLAAGLYSGHGQGSFRGGRYTDTVSALTPYSLYSEELSNAQVREIAAALAAHSHEAAMTKVREKGGVELDADEYADLARVFRKYADAGASLTGSW